MSRIGKKPIEIPQGVNVTMSEGVLIVKGPKGILTQNIDNKVNVDIKEKEILITVEHPDNKQQRSFWGLFRKLIANMVEGVQDGFSKQLEVNGVGYKAIVQGNKLILHLGYSHPQEFELPEGINAVVEGNIITISGIDKQVVGHVAASIRKLRKPEPYKGKGIKYTDEIIRRKAGKAAKAAA